MPILPESAKNIVLPKMVPVKQIFPRPSPRSLREKRSAHPSRPERQQLFYADPEGSRRSTLSPDA